MMVSLSSFAQKGLMRVMSKESMHPIQFSLKSNVLPSVQDTKTDPPISAEDVQVFTSNTTFFIINSVKKEEMLQMRKEAVQEVKKVCPSNSSDVVYSGVTRNLPFDLRLAEMAPPSSAEQRRKETFKSVRVPAEVSVAEMAPPLVWVEWQSVKDDAVMLST